MGSSDKRATPDVALLYAPTDDGNGARVLRLREGEVEAGEVRPIKDGQPLLGELVRLSPRKGAPSCICDVEVLHQRAPAEGEKADRAASVGPAQVATDTYRSNWDRTFGRGKRNQTVN